VLDLIDGQRSLADILTALGEPAELGFASRNAMEAFVEKVTGLAG
jgi:hypothetical protein